MFKHILFYELKYWLKTPAFYLYFIAFCSIAFVAITGTAGLFDPPPTNNDIERLVNSPFEINYMLQYFCKLLIFLLPAIIGATIYKDFKKDRHSLLYSFPIKKTDYLFGKFLIGFFLVCFIAFSVGIVMAIAEHVPGLHATKIGDFKIVGYLQALFVFIIPNLFFFGMIVFAVVTYFRNIYAGFIALILLFFLQNIAENAFSGISIAMIDPFGQNAVGYETQHWTLSDQNTRYIPVLGAVIYNRLIWFAFSTLMFLCMYWKFTFTEQPNASVFKKKKKTKKLITNFDGIQSIALPKVGHDFSNIKQFKYAWVLSKVNFQTITKSWMFYLIAFFGILAVLFSIAKVTNNNEMSILPFTHVVLTLPAFFFTTIIMLLTFMYSGLLIRKDDTTSMNQLVDVTPISNFALLTSKVLAVIKMQALLLVIMMLVGIAVQIYNSYYHFEVDLYLFHLFVYLFIGLIIWALVSVFMHTLIKNTYVGIFMLVILWLGISGLNEIGNSTRLLLFNFSEPVLYSDLNGYSNQLKSYFLVKGYWLAFTLSLMIIAYLLYGRGITQSLKERLHLAKLRFSGSIKIMLSICITATVALGLAIHSEESKSQELTSKERNRAFSDFEKDFAKYAIITNQPKIIDIDLAIDIFPEINKLEINGSYLLVNKSPETIDTLLVKTGFDELTTMAIDRASKIIDEDTYVKFSVLKLERALKPNDTLTIDFHIKSKPNTLFENNSNVLSNGTFFKNDIFPRFGYFLAHNQKNPHDSKSKNSHYYAADSDAIHLNTIISTSKNQTAIAPGYLKRQWTENQRNYFQYNSDIGIKNSLSFSSGEYEINKEIYKGIHLEVFHHENHTHNIKKMKDGLKAALDYNTKHFGSYQFKEARIIEFPITEGTYASVMANSIPTSEMRFIANASAATIDISFYTIAHELTHQWFGNQLVPANALGATMLSESITEYISLKIYEQQYGKEKALQFLKEQHGRYLRGRTKDKEEQPLYLVNGEQQYLTYGKGTIAMNTLSHYLGKNRLHDILKAFLENYKFKAAPYPTSIDFLNHIKESTPQELQYLIEDYFETVTFHDAKIKSASINQNDLTLDFEFSKYRNEDVTSLSDYLQIGFYNTNDELISIEQILVTSKNNKRTFKLTEKPSKIVLDPTLLLIEKNKEDNTFKL